MSARHAELTRGAPISPTHRDRLRHRGLPAGILEELSLRLAAGPALPEWWEEYGNALYLRDGFEMPADLLQRLVTFPFSGALLVVATDLTDLTSLLVGGDGPTVFIGADTYLAAAEIYCGAESTVVLSHRVVATARAMIDARNGGAVIAEPDQMWAANVYVATDDMHRLEDAATGARLNPFGARIRFGEHVWLGREAIVTGESEIGSGAVVGMRSLVRGQKVLPGTAVAGTPARLIREGVVWRHEDSP